MISHHKLSQFGSQAQSKVLFDIHRVLSVRGYIDGIHCVLLPYTEFFSKGNKKDATDEVHG